LTGSCPAGAARRETQARSFFADRSDDELVPPSIR
jgi:hypothetical protein